MTATLHDFQRRAVDDVTASLRRGGRVVLVSPTGTGKTVMAAAICREFGGRILWMTHRRELVMQAAGHLRSVGLCVGTMPSLTPAVEHPVTVASVQTLVRRDARAADLVVVDECHHVAAASYRKVLDHFDGVPVLGLTATPERLDGRGLGDAFDTLYETGKVREMIDMGYLAEPDIYAPPGPDTHGVRTIGGDFDRRAVSARMQGRLVGDVIEHWKQHARGKATLLFAVNVAESRRMERAFLRAGVTAVHVDAHTSTARRDEVFRAFRARSIEVVCNVELVTEGFDFPDLECVIIARPTQSVALYMQMVGRVMRTAEGKSGAVVIDHAGNFDRCGDPTEGREWTLDGVQGEPKTGLRRRRCQQCFRVLKAGQADCPSCGWSRQAASKDGPDWEAGDLVLRSKSSSRRAPFADREAVWDALRALAERGGMGLEWCRQEFAKTFGQPTLDAQGRLSKTAQRVCTRCGKAFDQRPDEPRGNFDRRSKCLRPECGKEPKACARCGVTFGPRPNESRDTYVKRTTCSVKCWRGSISASVIKHGIAPKKCVVCDAEFGIGQGESRFDFARRKTCAASCRYKTRRPKAKRCRVCGVEFRIRPDERSIDFNRRMTCSLDCRTRSRGRSPDRFVIKYDTRPKPCSKCGKAMRIRGSEKARDFERRRTCGTDKCRKRRREVMA